MLVVMGSGGETVRETVACAQRARRACRRGAGAAVPAVPGAGAASRRCPRPCASIAVLDRTKEPGSIGEPLFLDTVAALTESFARRRAGGDAEGRRRPLRPVLEGVHAGHGRRRVRRAGAASGRGAGSRSASTTTSPGRASTTTRRSTSSRPRRCARSSSASARTGRSARTRTRSRSSAPRRACTRRATSSTTRRSPARRRSRTCASGRSRSGRPTSCSRRASSAATSSGCSTGSTCSAAAADGATLLLNCPRPPDEVWDALSRPVQEQILAKHIDAVRDRRRPDRPRGRPRRTDQHRPADLLLRPLRRAAARAGDRADQGGGRQDLRPARRRGGRAQPGRGRPRAGRSAPGRGARAGDGDAASCRRSSPRTRPSSFAPSPRRCWPAAATSCRSARCRWTAPIRAARRPTRSATSRSWSRSGTPTCASSAATAASSARTA